MVHRQMVTSAFEGSMRHEWVFDVLEDLKSYAIENGLHQLAAKADEALRAASSEIAAQDQGITIMGRQGRMPH
jgi:hypothetical protein